MFERTQILFALSEPVTITSDSFFAAPPTALADAARRGQGNREPGGEDDGAEGGLEESENGDAVGAPGGVEGRTAPHSHRIPGAPRTWVWRW